MRKHLSYSNVVSTICLFLLLGGAAFAATKIAKNSVGTKQLKNNAVTGEKVKSGSLQSADFANGQLPEGAQGPRGEKGEKGDTGPFPGVLPTGKTIRGNYAQIDSGSTVGALASSGYSFGFTLASAPTAVYIPVSTTGPNPNPTACPGSVTNPEAAAGFLCVYENTRFGSTASVNVIDPETNSGGSASKHGFELRAVSSATGDFGSIGSWAVTSP